MKEDERILYRLLIIAIGLTLANFGTVKAGEKLFPTEMADRQWLQFEAAGFSKSACGIIHRLKTPATCGVALGGLDTGCIDLETSGLWGYCTIFNSHVPRRGPMNLPFLGLSVGEKTWVLCDPTQAKAGEGDYQKPLEPVLMDLKLEGVEFADEIYYWGHYPVADLEYDTSAPVSVGLRAWAPFLPGDAVGSMMPGIIFEVQLRNDTDSTQSGTVAFSFPGALTREVTGSRFVREEVKGKFNGVVITSKKPNLRDIPYEARIRMAAGVPPREEQLAIGVVGKETFRLGGELGVDDQAWAKISGELPNGDATAGASVAVDFSLKGGKTKTVRFVMSWYSPTWKGGGHTSAKEGDTFVHMYAKYYNDARKTAELLAKNHKALLKRILDWQEVIYSDAKLPLWLRESLVNILYVITEDSMWAQKEPPVNWVDPDLGLFGFNECPRGCPQIECIGCSSYGNLPLVYFFPECALSTLHGYKAYQYPEGAMPWIFGGVTGQTPPIDFARPTRGYQTTMNGFAYTEMVDRYWLSTGDDDFIREFYPSVKKNLEFTMDLRPQYSIGDRVISMPEGNIGSCWVETAKPGTFGMVTQVGGFHLAQIMMAQRMAQHVGDMKFARQCQLWLRAGKTSLEKNLWADNYYLTFWEPESNRKSELVFANQLDGQFMARFHGLAGMFQADRVQLALEKIKQCNVALSKSGAVNYAQPDGSPVGVAAVGDQASWAGYGTYGYFPPEALILAMTYIYEGQKEFGLDLSKRVWENIVLKWGYSWDAPNIMRGDEDTGERFFGYDYYQNMILWSLVSVLGNEDLGKPAQRGGLVDRIVKAAGK